MFHNNLLSACIFLCKVQPTTCLIHGVRNSHSLLHYQTLRARAAREWDGSRERIHLRPGTTIRRQKKTILVHLLVPGRFCVLNAAVLVHTVREHVQCTTPPINVPVPAFPCYTPPGTERSLPDMRCPVLTR
eukprot:3841613-Rhodomonas_salina.3